MATTERAAIVLDLENLVGPTPSPLTPGDLHEALVGLIGDRVAVSLVGYCVRQLQRRLAFDLSDLGVRVFGHSDPRPDAADHLILQHLRSEIPASATTVIIGSGDHIFAPIASELRLRGLRVEVAARPGTLAAALYREAECWHPLHPRLQPTSNASSPLVTIAA